jgi:hypothetical protein
MAKRAKRRPFFRRPNPQQRSEEVARDQARLRSAARDLVGSMTDEQLSGELAVREWRLEEADRLAQLEPGPGTLARYRASRFECEAARAAVEMARERGPDA